ncbi:isoform a [Stylonychia lemnae]|uniref:ER membrane protein complex subunit 2 n=1 Tax=Stylonychia lemnae TaxID=5949 RepID=A0A078AGK2_STYLE|nr:isoform a [Stylonychia lemnae]|eukprot:CDW79983.1 isoform a [Stylonychia lemnae]
MDKDIKNHQQHLKNLIERSKKSFAYYLIEEAFYAALDIKQLDWANAFLRIITSKFTQSVKSMRMLGMLYEALQDHEKAKEIYQELILLNPNDTQSVKRLVALERDRNHLSDAITLLNKYLENNQQDMEAWLELTDMYLAKQNYAKASFCYEEVLSLQPNNFIVNLRYAEMLYSQGGADNLDSLYLARKYYSHALTMQDDKSNMLSRALWGLLQTCKQLDILMKNKEEKNTEIILTCQQKLKEIYSKSNNKIEINSMKLMN